MNETHPSPDAAPNARPKRRFLCRALKALAIVVLLLAVAYGGLCGWYYSQQPRLTRNYAEELNAPILNIPPEKRAWTRFRRALELLDPRQQNELADKPGDKDWPTTAAYLKRNADALDMIRQAAKIRPMGVLLHDGVDPQDVAWRLRHDFTFDEGDAKNAPARSDNPSLAAMFLNAASVSLTINGVLSADAYLAAEHGDSQRLTANLLAMLDLAEQVNEGPFLVNHLIATTIAEMAAAAAGASLADSPDVIRHEDLTALDVRLRQIIGEQEFRFNTKGETAYFADWLQRYYTDDGTGDGVFTIDGEWGEEDEESDEGEEWADRIERWWDRFRVPIWAAFVMPRRAELEAANDRYFREIDRILGQPYWRRDAELEDLVDEIPVLVATRSWEGSMPLGFGYADTVSKTDARLYQQLGGVLVALALVRHRRAHDEWPATLADLAPGLLDDVPLDQLTGQPLKYNLLDGRPVVYSVGADRDDDGGRPPPPDDDSLAAWVWAFAPTNPRDGDWILWPPVERAEDAQIDPDGEEEPDRDGDDDTGDDGA